MARHIARYEPMSELVRSGMFPDLDNFLREFSLSPIMRGVGMEPRMKIDVEDMDQNYVVKAEVPGVKKEEISVDISGNTVSIRAEMKEERKDEKRGNMLYSERYFGEASRSFTLPQDVDESKAEAKYENGILTLTLPKKQGAGGKKLTIQ
jgi:HSP20 family protein